MSEVVISAHQPNFIPYLGFFDKMKKSDIFVIRDDVLFSSNSDSFQHRNKIRINGNNNLENPQWKWLTLPIEKKSDLIKNIRIKRNTIKKKDEAWNVELLSSIKKNYGNSKFFNGYFPVFERIFDNSDETLLSLNMKIINFLKNVFGIKTKVVLASSLGIEFTSGEEKNASEDLARICAALGGSVYLSGFGGKGYLDLEPFKKRGIKVIFQEYNHPVYEQNYPGFLPNLSSIDGLFCAGRKILADTNRYKEEITNKYKEEIKEEILVGA